MLRTSLEYFDRTVSERYKIILAAIVFTFIADIVVSSELLFKIIFSGIAGVLLYLIRNKRNYRVLVSVVFTSIAIFFTIILFNILVFYIDFFTLKYFYNFYSVLYLPHLDVSLSSLVFISMLITLLLPNLARLLNFNSFVFKDKKFSIVDFMVQLLMCLTVVLLLFILNSVVYDAVEIYTATLAAKSTIAVLGIVYLASYAEGRAAGQEGRAVDRN